MFLLKNGQQQQEQGRGLQGPTLRVARKPVALKLEPRREIYIEQYNNPNNNQSHNIKNKLKNTIYQNTIIKHNPKK